MKVSYEATIPTGQYANVKPRIEFDNVDNLDVAFEEALEHFIKIVEICGEKPDVIKRNELKK